jgi:hypothetical protein
MIAPSVSSAMVASVFFTLMFSYCCADTAAHQSNKNSIRPHVAFAPAGTRHWQVVFAFLADTSQPLPPPHVIQPPPRANSSRNGPDCTPR